MKSMLTESIRGLKVDMVVSFGGRPLVSDRDQGPIVTICVSSLGEPDGMSFQVTV